MRLEEKNNTFFEVFLVDEDIVNCPYCGARTDFIELENSKQLHNCLNCKSEFLTEFETD